MKKRVIFHRAFMVPVLLVAVALVTLGYLSLSLFSARVGDKAQERQAKLVAFYAAESGMVLAESKLLGQTTDAPPAGIWFTGELSKSLSRYRVEVSPEDYSPDYFRVRVVGRKRGERGAVYISELEAGMRRALDRTWQVEWRKQR